MEKHQDVRDASTAAAAKAVAMRPIPREAIESGGRAAAELAIRIDQERRAEHDVGEQQMSSEHRTESEATEDSTSLDSDDWPTPSVGDEVIVTGEYVNGGQLRPLVVEAVPETSYDQVLRDSATGAVETRPSYELTPLVDGEVPAGIAAARARRERSLGEA